MIKIMIAIIGTSASAERPDSIQQSLCDMGNGRTGGPRGLKNGTGCVLYLAGWLCGREEMGSFFFFLESAIFEVLQRKSKLGIYVLGSRRREGISST